MINFKVHDFKARDPHVRNQLIAFKPATLEKIEQLIGAYMMHNSVRASKSQIIDLAIEGLYEAFFVKKALRPEGMMLTATFRYRDFEVKRQPVPLRVSTLQKLQRLYGFAVMNDRGVSKSHVVDFAIEELHQRVLSGKLDILT